MKEFAKHVKYERELHSWSQEQVAEMIGTTGPNVSRWERGITIPNLYFRQKLCELFGKSAGIKQLSFDKLWTLCYPLYGIKGHTSRVHRTM